MIGAGDHVEETRAATRVHAPQPGGPAGIGVAAESPSRSAAPQPAEPPQPPAGTHVGLNLLFLVPGETGGMEVYARELIPQLLAAAPQLRFTAFINREAAHAGGGPWGELLPAVALPVSARSRVQWVLGEQTLLPAMAARARVGLLHSLASTAPLWGPFGRIATVHDLIYARFPEAHPGLRDRGMRVLVPAAARRSQRVIAISRSTRDDLVALLGLAPAKIDVIAQAPGTTGRARALPEPQTRERFGLGGREVVLSLSAKRPHKNLARAARRAGADRCRPSAVAGAARLSDLARGRAARARGSARRERRRALPGLGLGRGARGAVGAGASVRVPLDVRGLRAARARGDGARGPGGLLERLVAARGRRRRGVAVRSVRRGGDRRGDRSVARSRRAHARACACTWAGPCGRVQLAADRARDARELCPGTRLAALDPPPLIPAP